MIELWQWRYTDAIDERLSPLVTAQDVLMAKGKGPDIAGAEKKLRQAEFFLGHLEYTSQEMVNELARGGVNTEPLEFFFSACLTAAQSVFSVLEETGGSKFYDLQNKWRKGLTNDPGKISFARMKGLRGKDVHFAITGATPRPKYVEEDRRGNQSPYQTFLHHNAAWFGPAPVIEEVNPDGTKVRASALRGSIGLYLDHRGVLLEATTVCRDFIGQLRSLLNATRDAFPPDGAA